MRQLVPAVIIGVILVPSIALAQSLSDYTRGTTGSGYYPINATNQTSGATLTSGPSTGVPGTVKGYTPLEPLSTFNNGRYENFADYLATVYRLAITVGALIAVVMLVTGGVRYMLSESFTNKDAAKARIRNALWGLVILVGSFLILYTINPNLLNFKLLLPNLTPQTPTTNLGSGKTSSCGEPCSAGFFCDPAYGLCTSNDKKAVKDYTEACAARGGTRQTTLVFNSQYCGLTGAKTKENCDQAGGIWYDASYVLPAYCYLKD